jgi:hypothetical protein
MSPSMRERGKSASYFSWSLMPHHSRRSAAEDGRAPTHLLCEERALGVARCRQLPRDYFQENESDLTSTHRPAWDGPFELRQLRP